MVSWLESQADQLESKTFSERCELVLEKSCPRLRLLGDR